ncbi:MAG: YIP1 family protein [Xanthobacteraceae bacterium]|nr:YIP1 family protein [Xanthobacteraceae bacterium]
MAGIVDRVKNILLTPKTEWPVIDGEPGDTKEVFTYVAILALLPLVGGIIGGLLAGPLPLVYVIFAAIVGYVLAFVVVYVVAFIIDALAPTFSSEKHFPSALKLTAYAYTASWVAGFFAVIPVLGGLIALAGGIYSLYLLYIGLPTLMRTPQEKVMGYFIVALICAIVVSIVITAVIGGLLLFPLAALVAR